MYWSSEEEILVAANIFQLLPELWHDVRWLEENRQVPDDDDGDDDDDDDIDEDRIKIVGELEWNFTYSIGQNIGISQFQE